MVSKQNEDEISIIDLSTDVLITFSTYLDIDTSVELSSTCKYFRSLIKDVLINNNKKDVETYIYKCINCKYKWPMTFIGHINVDAKYLEYAVKNNRMDAFIYISRYFIKCMNDQGFFNAAKKRFTLSKKFDELAISPRLTNKPVGKNIRTQLYNQVMNIVHAYNNDNFVIKACEIFEPLAPKKIDSPFIGMRNLDTGRVAPTARFTLERRSPMPMRNR